MKRTLKQDRQQSAQPLSPEDLLLGTLGMQAVGADLASHMKRAQLNKHELARVAGLSPSYIGYLERNEIKKVGRDKIVWFATAANLDLEKTNQILARYQLDRIGPSDASLFIQASRRRKIIGVQPVYHGLGYDVLMLALERLEGDLVVVHDMPLAALRSPEYAIFSDSVKWEEKWAMEFQKLKGLEPFDDTVQELYARRLLDSIYLEIRLGLHRERLKNVRAILSKGFSVELLVCRGCFEDHVAQRSGADTPERQHLVQHLATHLVFMRQFPAFRFRLVEDCPQLRFEIKHTPGKADDGHVFLSGKVRHYHVQRTSDRLLGFASDSRKLYKFLNMEYARLRDLAGNTAWDPEAVREQIIGVCEKRDIKKVEILRAEKMVESLPLYA